MAGNLDKPVACVVAKAGAAPGEDELIAFCRAGLASGAGYAAAAPAARESRPA